MKKERLLQVLIDILLQPEWDRDGGGFGSHDSGGITKAFAMGLLRSEMDKRGLIQYRITEAGYKYLKGGGDDQDTEV